VVTALDTNVLSALLRGTPQESKQANLALQKVSQGDLVIAPVVFAELTAIPGADEALIDAFLKVTHITIDWDISEAIWREAARAYRGYARQRRSQKGDSGPRRILADFVIGAHAFEREASLLTYDKHLYQTAFPKLKLLS
jgi:predicted nucleic acid-binding protein